MKADLQIFKLLERNELDEFLLLASELDSYYWNNLDVLMKLIKSLKISSLGFRDFAHRIILNVSESYKPTAANLLIDYLYQTDKELRNLAADLLMKLGESSNDSLLQLLSEDDVYIKKFASDIHGVTGSDKEIPDLVMLLNDPDMNVFNSAIEAIGSIFDRHKDQIGLADSMLDLLFSIFNVDNTNTKPVIIESISKIGGSRAADFLLEVLSNEEDIFLQTTAIEGLSICGDSPILCEKLQNEIGNYPKEIQPIVLKTLLAIAFRIGFELNYSEELKSIARIALSDSDPDTRTAGLLSLGPNYSTLDIVLISKEYEVCQDEMKYYILSNLLTESNIDLYEDFLNDYIASTSEDDHNYCALDMVGLIHNLSEDLDDEIIRHLMQILTKNLIICLELDQYEIFDSINQLNPTIFKEVVAELQSAFPNSTDYNKILEYLDTEN